jgi:hypothetical protein
MTKESRMIMYRTSEEILLPRVIGVKNKGKFQRQLPHVVNCVMVITQYHMAPSVPSVLEKRYYLYLIMIFFGCHCQIWRSREVSISDLHSGNWKFLSLIFLPRSIIALYRWFFRSLWCPSEPHTLRFRGDIHVSILKNFIYLFFGCDNSYAKYNNECEGNIPEG